MDYFPPMTPEDLYWEDRMMMAETERRRRLERLVEPSVIDRLDEEVTRQTLGLPPTRR